MLRIVLFTFVAFALVSAVNVQNVQLSLPRLGSGNCHDSQDNGYPVICSDGDHTRWNLNLLPNPNSTEHLIFDTVYSLLQQWSNTRMRKGHNIVPGIIPKGTLLYHGTIQNNLPPGPEWVAMDPEHAYAYCWDLMPTMLVQDRCWYLTLMTSRPLNIVYFDGSSAAKFTDGSLDAQDLIIWGESRAEDVFHELERIADLCRWVRGFGTDGIVRMGVDFEVMLCDFTSGVDVVTFVNLEPPKGVRDLSGFATFEIMNAHSRHNRFPGETRILLDLARLVSFYDTQLVPSLVPIRANQERWDHRLLNISEDDLSAVKSRIEEAMTGPWGSSSGINWKTLTQVIVDLFSQRLELTRHLVDSLTIAGPEDMIDLARKTQTQLRIILTPYILLSATPTDSPDGTDMDWAIPIYKHCATTHTTYAIDSESMTESEQLILRAIQGTVGEICRVVTKMWVSGIYAGLDPSLNTKESIDVAEMAHVRRNWAEELNRLMKWLDWSVWVKCSPECEPEEMCYLPTWPVGFPGVPLPSKNVSDAASALQEGRSSFELRMLAMGKIAHFVSNMFKFQQQAEDSVSRPRPKCVRRFAPFTY